MREWIINNLTENNKLLSHKCKESWFIKNNYISEYKNIINLTSFLINPTLSQRIWHIVNNIYNNVKCNNPDCNNLTRFHTFKTGYLRTCCNKCAQLDPQTINKIKTTNIKRYGKEYGLSNKNIIEKRKQTCLQHYGVDNPTKSNEILDIIKTTNLDRYGIKWVLQDQHKKEQAIYKKYKINNIQQNKEIHQRTTITRKENFYNSLFTTNRLNEKVIPLFSKEDYINGGYYNNYKFKCLTCNTEFTDCLEDGDIPRCPICYKTTSLFEEEIYNFIKSICNYNILQHNRTILYNKELDIYIPDLKIAIECDGLYYHSSLHGHKDRLYHINKTLECSKQGIKLIHIFEDEWLYKKDIVKSMLSSLLNKTTDINTDDIKPVSYINSKSFLNNNHINGNCKSNIQLGLYYNNNLVYILTLRSLRNNNYKILRVCSKLNINIVDGFNKLILYFIDHYNPSEITLYEDNRWNIDNITTLYKIKEYQPKCWFFKKNYKRYSKLNVYYDKIYDCGYIKYRWNKSS